MLEKQVENVVDQKNFLVCENENYVASTRCRNNSTVQYAYCLGTFSTCFVAFWYVSVETLEFQYATNDSVLLRNVNISATLGWKQNKIFGPCQKQD